MRCGVLTIFEIIDDLINDGANTVNHISIQNGKKVDGEMVKRLAITMPSKD
jgi:hypothetical protein